MATEIMKALQEIPKFSKFVFFLEILKKKKNCHALAELKLVFSEEFRHPPLGKNFIWICMDKFSF